MSNYDDEYVKNIEKQNEYLTERIDGFLVCFEQINRLLLLSSTTDMKGKKTYSVIVRGGSNNKDITEEEYLALSKIGVECEPHVDMRKKYETNTYDLESLNKKIQEAFEKLSKYR